MTQPRNALLIHGGAVVLAGLELNAAAQLAIAGAATAKRQGVSLTVPQLNALNILCDGRDSLQQALRHKRQGRRALHEQSPMTAKELAAQRGCSTRTIQRQALAYGGQKINGQWRFPAALRDQEGPENEN